jgi:hypothetical protein
MASPGLPHRARNWRAVTAASIGNAFEWFDFILYGFFAVTIAKLFFPTGNETASLLLTLASFGVTLLCALSAQLCWVTWPIAAGERQR